MFESGRNSISRQLMRMGYKIFVIDKKGESFEEQSWVRSKTFWTGEQENLLVEDNQTRIYQKAEAQQKRQLSLLAWGTYE